MTFRFTWKIIGSDAFEQDFPGYSSEEEAKKVWELLWQLDEACLEYLHIEEL